MRVRRFSEALLQCDSLLEATTAAAAADTTAGEADSCTVVALKSSALSQSLSQQYLCGYTLQMPVPSVLASDCLELPSESYSEQTSRAKAAAAVKVGGGETGSGDALDFELLLSRATDSNSGVCFERIRNDRAVSLTEWRQKVNKQKSRLRFLLRKYGV